MPRKWAHEYVSSLVESPEHMALVDLSQCLCCSPAFSGKAADYGLPQPAFVVVEAMVWFSQSIRSGAWTYFEATPEDRQVAMRNALQSYGAPQFAHWYGRGMLDWKSADRMKELDEWICANESAGNRWLHEHARMHRELMLSLTA